MLYWDLTSPLAGDVCSTNLPGKLRDLCWLLSLGQLGSLYMDGVL